jgi:hypothetical protein
VGREEKLVDQLQPLLEPGEAVSHAFVANHGAAKPSPVAMVVVAVTDRSIVTAAVSHTVRWKVTASEVGRWDRAPFADLPGVGGPGFERWSWNGLDLWLDRRARKAADAANREALGG